MTRRLPQVLAGSSLALTVLAFLVLALWPDGYSSVSSTVSVTTSSDGSATVPSTPATLTTRTSESLLESQGPRVLIVLAIPVVLAAVGVAAVLARSAVAKTMLWAAAVLLSLFAFITGFSIGLFFIPSAGLLIAAAAVSGRPARQPT